MEVIAKLTPNIWHTSADHLELDTYVFIRTQMLVFRKKDWTSTEVLGNVTIFLTKWGKTS